MSNGREPRSDWPSALVALGILVLVGAIAISAIVHYNTVDDALKIWLLLAIFSGNSAVVAANDVIQAEPSIEVCGRKFAHFLEKP